LRLLKESPPAAGAEEILVAGEKEQRAAETNRREGVPLEEKVVAALEDLAAKYGIPSPFLEAAS
jgi:LDH2 family malate/lactate/ureidoglycolate dehydrogenase